MTMLLILVACLVAWAHVLHLLERSRERLGEAMLGDVRQGGGWMPSSDRRVSVAASGRSFIRA